MWDHLSSWAAHLDVLFLEANRQYIIALSYHLRQGVTAEILICFVG
jgi:hypothetical protein